MNKSMGILMIALALVIGIVPIFTDCLANGRSLTTAEGMVSANEMSLDRHCRNWPGSAAGADRPFQFHQQTQGNIAHAQHDRFGAGRPGDFVPHSSDRGMCQPHDAL